MSEGAEIAAAGAPLEQTQSGWFHAFWSLLRAELSTYPRRPLLVLRIMLACTFVMLAIIVFRIPGGVLGAYYPLLISRDNLHATRRSAVWIAAACTCGVIEVVLGAMLFAGSPPLHLLWVWASLFIVFYIVSTLKVYEAAVAMGLLIANAILIWDQPVSADLRLRQTLFTLLAILIGCAVSVLIEYFFSRAHSADAVIEGVEERLKLTAGALRCIVSDNPERTKVLHEIRRRSAQGTAILQGYVVQAGYKFEDRQRLSTAVALSGRLIDITAAFAAANPQILRPGDADLCIAISEHLLVMSRDLLQQKGPDWIPLEGQYETNVPALIEMERTVDLLTESLSRAMWEPVGNAPEFRTSNSGRDIFVDDAFGDATHWKFAVRGTLSAVACYMFYMSLGWVGLGASVSTCILTALPVTGAARHKQLTRFAGVVLGACALGFTAQSLILPQIDSIFSYTILFAIVTFIGAWIGTSGPRIAYCGIQIVLAYEMVNLNRFSINPSLVPARDVVLGIAAGIGAMWLIFDNLWATSSAEALRPLLSATILDIARLPAEVISVNGIAAEMLLEKRISAVMRNFQKLFSLLDASLFEAAPKESHAELLLCRNREYLPQLRVVLFLKSGLIHHRILSGNECLNSIAETVLHRSSELLEQFAQKLNQGADGISISSAETDEQIRMMLLLHTESMQEGSQEWDATELRLCSSLFHVVQHLVTAY